MSKQMLINVTQAEESRVAISENGILDWIEIETGGREKLKGNIYKGVVESVNSSLQAAFVKFASGARAGFLPLDEVNFRILPHRGRFSGKGGRQESPPERSSGRGSRSRISDHLKSGQELLVQVVREAYSSKPPTLSTFISIPGRYLVLLPGSETGGVSRRIEDESRRERLKKLIKELKVPDDMGLIVRTAGLDRSKTELGRDLRYLTRLWKQIETAWPKATPPALIFQERDLVLRAIRDLFTPDVREVLVDSEEIYKRAVRYFKSIMPGKQKLLKLYTGEQPLFTQYNLESQIENIYKRRVPLKSGGAIVIDSTEALTSIDVNSGRTREAGIEGTAHRTNMEAASEIARQLRLRDIGGLIVIDFIDMRGRSNIRDVERQLREAMKKDTARYDLTKISKLGLLEMSRQRMRAGPAASSYRPCKTCEGSGVVKTVESASLSILRRIHTRSARGDLARIRILLPEEVARYLLNRKRADLVRLEERYMTEIQIIGRSDMNLTDLQFEVQSRDDRAREQGKDVEPQVKHPETQEGSERSRKSERAGKRVRRRRAGEKKDSGQSAGAPAEVAVAAVPEKPAAESGPRPVRRRGRRRKTGEKKDAAQVASDSDQGRSDAESGASDAVPRPPAAESVPQPVRRRARRRRTGEKKESVRAAADSGQGGSRTGSSVGDSSSPAAAAPVSQPAGRRARRRRSGGKQASLANSGEDRGDLSRKVPGDGEPGAEGAGKGKKPIRRRRPRGGRSRKSRAAGKGAPPSSNGQMEGPNQSESQPADLRITGPPDVVSGSDMKPASVAEPGTESPRPARREAGARNSAS